MYGDNYGYRSGLNRSMVAAPDAQGEGPRNAGRPPRKRMRPRHRQQRRNAARLVRRHQGCVSSGSIRRHGDSREYYPAGRRGRSGLLLRRRRFRECERQAGADRHLGRDVLRPRGSRGVCAGRTGMRRAPTASGTSSSRTCRRCCASTPTTRSATSTSSTTRWRTSAGFWTRPGSSSSMSASTASTAGASPSPRLAGTPRSSRTTS